MSVKRIHLAGPAIPEEGVAAEAITPGHLIAFNSSGELVKNAAAGAACEVLFACEDALQGNGIATAYADGDRVTAVTCQQGADIYGYLAAGETVTPATLLASNGDGTLRAVGVSDIAIARSKETLDNTDSAAVDARLKIRVI